MSSTRNRNKASPQSAESKANRRMTRSSDPRETPSPITKNKDAEDLILFQCKYCHFILSSSSNILKRLKFNTRILGFSPKDEGFIRHEKEILLSPEGQYDEFCAYNHILCANCSEILGKFYLSTTEKVDEGKGLFLIPESSFVVYDVGTSKIQRTPSTKGEHSSSKKVIVGKSTSPKDSGARERTSISSKKDTSGLGTHTPRSILNRSFIADGLDDDELRQVKKIDDSFNDMKNILSNFAQLLQQFDVRLSSSERVVALINETLTQVYKELNVKDLVDG